MAMNETVTDMCPWIGGPVVPKKKIPFHPFGQPSLQYLSREGRIRPFKQVVFVFILQLLYSLGQVVDIDQIVGDCDLLLRMALVVPCRGVLLLRSVDEVSDFSFLCWALDRL